MLKLSNLTKIYYTDEVETTALDQVNLQVDEGDYVAIKGPSGCGKSTLMNIIGLVDTPTSGELELFNKTVQNFKESERTIFRRGKIGFIFQKFNLIDTLSVFDNIELPLLYLKITKSERYQRVNTVLSRLGISHRAKHFPSQLSGGQQQRVAVARCIVTDPPLILADEPTGNLDSQNGEEVMKILEELNKEGKTIILVTHDNDYANQARKTINMLDGTIFEDGI